MTSQPSPNAATITGDIDATAEALVRAGAVSNLRVISGNGVVTGVVADTHRVYLRRAPGQPNQLLEAECTCGSSVTCVHAQAVLLAAANQHPVAPAATVAPRTAPGNVGADTRQQLRYVLQPAQPTNLTRQLQLSIWIDQQPTHPASACAFVPRTAGGGQGYPRYVNQQDRALLQQLIQHNSDGPWVLDVTMLDGLLEQIIRTGRACWMTLTNPPLRVGQPRPARLHWQLHSNGSQSLACEVTPPATTLILTQLPGYIDAASSEWGPLTLRSSTTLAQHFWSHGALTPEDVPNAVDLIQATAANAQHEPVVKQPANATRCTDAMPLAIDANHASTCLASPHTHAQADATSPCTTEDALGNDSTEIQQSTFPVPCRVRVETQPRHRLQARLILSAGPAARLELRYNDLSAAGLGAMIDTPSDDPLSGGNELLTGPDSVDQADLTDDTCIRILTDQIVYEIPRDLHAEHSLRSQFITRLPTAGAGIDAWLSFMLDTLPTLREQSWDVQIAPGFPYALAPAGQWYMNTETATGWVDVTLGMQVADQCINLLPALADYLQGLIGTGLSPCRRIGSHLLVRLPDERFLPVPIDRLQQVADTLVELFDHDALGKNQALRLPTSHASRLAQVLEQLPRPALISSDTAFAAALQALKDHGTPQPLAAPPGFNAELRTYQREGLGWLQHLRQCGLGGVLADDMGLGKTVQTLAHLALEHAQGRLQHPTLIVAPVSVIGNWQREARRLAPQLKVFTLHGPRRHEYFAAIPQAQLIITSYPLLPIDIDVLSAQRFYYVVLDEAQTIKNPKAQVSQAARTLQAEHRLCLTGTPMENHLGELWSLVDFVQPGILGSEREFQRRYRQPIERTANEARSQALSRRIAPFILRRTKDAVAPDLPQKTQIVESIELEEQQRQFYDSVRLASHRRVRDSIQQQGLARSQITVLDALLKLRQACCDPRLLTDEAAQAAPSAKLQWLCEVLPEMVAQGRRILLFSQFTSMLALIAAEVRRLGIKHLLLTGQTRERMALVERFQSGEIPLFLISLKAGGTGLNLTRADTVIHYDPWWNPAAEAQATDRAHRIGQHNPVFVYKLITQDTVEERILKLQEHKQVLASQLYAATHGNPLHLDAAELDMLLAPAMRTR